MLLMKALNVFGFYMIIHQSMKPEEKRSNRWHYLWQPPKLNVKAVPSLRRGGTIPKTQTEQDG